MASIKNLIQALFYVDPVTGHRKISVFLSKPWVIILITCSVMLSTLVLSMNQIMLTLLHSRPEVVVPDLEKKGLMDALRKASEFHLALEYDGVDFDEGLPAGTVVRQSPAAGMKVRTGRAIRVVISKGGQAIFVPLVTARPLAEAQSMLGMEGLQVGGVTDVFSEEFEEGYVVSQDPSSGTIVTRGALVDLGVSQGPPPAGMPVAEDFVGRPIEDVKVWAESRGVRLDIKEDAKAVGQSGTVVQQDPIPGQPILPKENFKITIVPLLASGQGFRLTYQLPKDAPNPSDVKMVARDSRGESEVYNGKHAPGQVVEIPMNVTSTTRVRIYVNGLLSDEKVLEP